MVKKQKTNIETSIPGFWNAIIQNNSKIIFSRPPGGSKKFMLNVEEENQQNHGTWFQTRMTNDDHSQPPIISLTNNLKSGSQVDSKGKLLPPKGVKPATLKTRKIKVHLRNEKDRQVLNKTFGCVRWVYNECVRALNTKREEKEKEVHPKTGKPLTWLQYLRKHILHSKSETLTKNPWLKETGYDIRDDARARVLTALKTNLAKMKKSTITHFKLQFQSKKKLRSESIWLSEAYIDISKVKKGTIILNLPKQKPIKLWKMDQEIPPIFHECRLQRTKTNDFYLCIPVDVEGVEKQDPQKNIRVCSLDPGDRTFQTIYDPSRNHTYEVGVGDRNGIFKYCLSIDRLISKQALQKNSKKRSSMKRAIRRMYIRLRNRINEVHKQLVRFLVTNYDLILLPSFNTSQMVTKKSRKILSQTVRTMLTWSHYRFKERLLFKCGISDSKVIIVDEAYTSKTCSMCGTQNHSLGGKKTFVCPNTKCKMIMDRDFNGARNIFLKNQQVLGISVSNSGSYPLPSSDGCTETFMFPLDFNYWKDYEVCDADL